jgi:hypothetical protein
MQTGIFAGRFRRSVIVALAFIIALAAPAAEAARVAVLSNKFSSETAADFGTKMPAHSFTAIDTSIAVPQLSTLKANFDILLVFEDGTFANSTGVGDVSAQFAAAGHAVVLGTFYEQDRSDGNPNNSPHGWGALENIDPNTTDGVGTPYLPRTLNAASIVQHPLTTGVTSLTSAKFAGGNSAKIGTTIVATWTQKNARGEVDPAIDYLKTGSACVIHVAIAPHYPSIGTPGVDFSGDFYRAWSNAFDFGASQCVVPSASGIAAIPTLQPFALALSALLVAALAAVRLRRARR